MQNANTSSPRRVLILGGTAWLGRHIAQAALERGDEVVCVARGYSGSVAPGVRWVSIDRRDAGAYDDLTGDWDEVVELSYDPDLVVPALEALAARAAHWTLISSVSVYARGDEPAADESAELVSPEDLARYPDAKVAAERASAARLGDRLLIGRAGLIVGPGDPSDRFGYWPARMLRGGDVLAPTLAPLWSQVVDVADLAAWVVAAGARGETGPVNAVGASVPLAELLAEVAASTGFTGELHEVSEEDLLAAGAQFWAGPMSLPLWLPRTETGFARRDGSAFVRTGGVARPLRETIDRVRDDERARGIDRPRRAGLSASEEEAVRTALKTAAGRRPASG